LQYAASSFLGAYESLAGFRYGQLVNITGRRGDNHNCYCIDVATAELIWSLPKRKSPLKWDVRFWPGGHKRLACRGFLSVFQTEHGFLACRQFRSNGHLVSFTLAHQLTDSPIVFPSLELGMAAAELCFPKPNRALGYMWWDRVQSLTGQCVICGPRFGAHSNQLAPIVTFAG
jgi:hypothetical protein